MRREHDLLGLGRRKEGAADAHAVLPALHFELSDAGFSGQVDQLSDLIDCHSGLAYQTPQCAMRRCAKILSMRLLSLALAALVVLPWPGYAAGDSALDRATLRGLKAVNIVVDRLDPELEAAGITAATLHTRIDARLMSASVPVDRAATEFLGLRITQVKAGRGTYALCMELGVYQPVVLVRDDKVKTATDTWAVVTVLMSDQKQLQDATLTSVDELADGFAAAWKAANQ